MVRRPRCTAERRTCAAFGATERPAVLHRCRLRCHNEPWHGATTETTHHSGMASPWNGNQPASHNVGRVGQRCYGPKPHRIVDAHQCGNVVTAVSGAPVERLKVVVSDVRFPPIPDIRSERLLTTHCRHSGIVDLGGVERVILDRPFFGKSLEARRDVLRADVESRKAV